MVDCSEIKVFKALVIFCEAEYSVEERFDGLCSPIPPSLAGKANSSLSVSLGGAKIRFNRRGFEATTVTVCWLLISLETYFNRPGLEASY